jgi:hypothetical protein
MTDAKLTMARLAANAYDMLGNAYDMRSNLMLKRDRGE